MSTQAVRQPLYVVPKRSLYVRTRDFLEHERVLGYLLIIPAVVLLAALVAYPFLWGMYLSLQDKVVGRPGSYAGLQNFRALLGEGIFLQTLKNSLIYTVTAVGAKVVLGTWLALIIHRGIRRGRHFVRGAILLPFIVPTALSTLAWWWMFESLYSVINWTIIHLGLATEGPNWLGDPFYAKISVIIVNLWRGLPFFAITILAGLVSIPLELYDAAKVDGAGPINTFRHVTLPLLKPVLAIVILFSTIFTLADFNIVFLLTRGGPVNSTHVFATLANQIGLVAGKIGQGAAITLFLFPILVVVVVLQLYFIRKEEY
jgi:multiple sugar transport system permease protein